ncbi:MAG TPA: DUF222 domain-containing protein [Polyangia bacterium]|nr:DUF222 domain-containing protein [Polyangia bacterium]HVY38852.1 DUF222 domain-containing protein [Polyangia bacterium]
METAIELGEEIAALATQVNRATHGLLTRIRRFDEVEGWGEQGAKSCAHWLTWRIGLDPGTAREKVRVARALGTLPKLDEAFATGTLSYAKVRAVTRIATPQTEDHVLQVAMATTGAQLERICRRLRRATEAEQELAEERTFRARVLGTGLTKLEIVVTADEADIVIQAVERAREAIATKQSADQPLPRPRAADGLMEIVASYPAGQPTADSAAPSPKAQVVVHLERDLTSDSPTLTATLDDGTPVSAETFRRLACDGGLVPATVDEHHAVLDVGRRTRAIPTSIRRALWLRDKGCRFPGCASTRFLHGHHIQHWLHGGRTALANLVLLCSFHHRQVHEAGFTLTLTDGAEVVVHAPNGRNVSAETSDLPVVTWQTDAWHEAGGSAIPIPSWDGEPVDYDAAVDALWPAAESVSTAGCS